MRKGNDITPRYGNTFGSRITYVLACNGMTQVELANKIGKQQSSINFFVRNKRMPNLAVAIEIAKALDVSLDWLCCLED